jgi:hypothetical protein
VAEVPQRPAQIVKINALTAGIAITSVAKQTDTQLVNLSEYQIALKDIKNWCHFTFA